MKIYNSSNGCIMQYFEGKRLHDYIEYCKHIEKAVESEILCKRYGDYLKADIVQIAHHGYSGATVELYEYAAGKVALFPTAKEYFEKNKDRKANKKILELCNEVYIAGNGTACFKLPYILGTATVTKPELNID